MSMSGLLKWVSLGVLCSSLGWAQSPPPVRVVATFSIIADLAQAVGGPAIELVTLMSAGTDPHAFEPRPADAQALAQAQILISNGLGFEGWIDRLQQASGFGGVHIVLTEPLPGLKRLPLTEATHEHEHGQAFDTPHQDDVRYDPHAWHSMTNAMHYVRRIRDALIVQDPQHAAGYRQRAALYLQQMQQLDQQMRQQIAQIAVDDRRIITSHAAFAYLADDYAIQIDSLQGVSTDATVSAKHMARLIRSIRRQGSHALLLEQGVDGRLMQQIAAETGQVVQGPLYADTLSLPNGPAASYLQLMQHNLSVILAALRTPNLTH